MIKLEELTGGDVIWYAHTGGVTTKYIVTKQKYQFAGVIKIRAIEVNRSKFDLKEICISKSEESRLFRDRVSGRKFAQALHAEYVLNNALNIYKPFIIASEKVAPYTTIVMNPDKYGVFDILMSAFEANKDRLKEFDPQLYYALLDFRDSVKSNKITLKGH